MITTKVLSSLEKVFLDEEPKAKERLKGMALKGEKYSFQWAFCRDFENECGTQRYRLDLESPLKEYIHVYTVRNVACELPAYLYEKDEDYLRTQPGLFPDALEEVAPNFVLMPWQWRAVWVMVDIPKDAKPGKYPITLYLRKDETGKAAPKGDGEIHAEGTFTLEILNAELPEQELIFTQWFHNDCLATQYNVKLWSDKYWALFEKYVKNAADFGMNMLLTPIFTPPLDTEPGGERRTTQLLGVTKTGENAYEFDFTNLEKYIEIAEKCGIKYFELSHLFTQWGAAHAPKIIATVNGKEKRIFGWDTDSSSDEYQNFIKPLLKALIAWFTEKGMLDRVYFHFSDEPHLEHMEKYAAASAVAREILKDCNVIDALSEYPFYENGLIRNPIPSTYKAAQFYDKGVRPLWTYYCCDQAEAVSNRFIAQPSYRNRVLGMQMFKYDVKGFLHWGYNFWNSQFSLCPISPFETTDALCAFQSGDAFSVYAGKDGEPVPSLRQLVFNEGLQDMRALQLLATKMDKEDILEKLEEANGGTFNFYRFKRDSRSLLKLRKWVNEQIKARFC